jgi:hypothetical protein
VTDVDTLHRKVAGAILDRWYELVKAGQEATPEMFAGWLAEAALDVVRPILDEQTALAVEARDAWEYLFTQGVRKKRAEVSFGPAGGPMVKQPDLPDWTLTDIFRLVDEAYDRGEISEARDK